MEVQHAALRAEAIQDAPLVEARRPGSEREVGAHAAIVGGENVKSPQTGWGGAEALADVESSLVRCYLKLDSALGFVGDAGTTETGRGNMRLRLEVLDPRTNDITDYYPSRLPGAPAAGRTKFFSIPAKNAAFASRCLTRSYSRIGARPLSAPGASAWRRGREARRTVRVLGIHLPQTRLTSRRKRVCEQFALAITHFRRPCGCTAAPRRGATDHP